MRRILDKLYDISLWLAALCLATIGLMVGAQLAGRLVDGTLSLLHLPRTDFVILSLAEISGYLLAAASFLALAPTLKAGVHIRVTMALGVLSAPLRRAAEFIAFALAACAAGFMTWNFAKFAYVSWRFDEVSSGVVQVQLAYPQAVMALGALVLTVALIDEVAMIATRGRPSFRAAEEAFTVGKES